MKIKQLSIKEFTEEKDKSNSIVIKDYAVNLEAVEDRTATFIITTSTPDTVQDIIDPDGVDLTNYMKNPQFLWQHDRDQLPIGKCLSISKVPNGLKATFEFISADIYEFADTAFKMVQNGFLNAVSVGFIPTDIDPNEHGGFTINKWILFEVSLVTVPANPEALIVEDTPEPEKKFKNKIEVFKRKKLLSIYK